MAEPSGLKDAAEVCRWVAVHPLPPPHVDCAVAVMLKILDGKCKMKEDEKVIMRHLYHAVKHQPGERLDEKLRVMIAQAEASTDNDFRDQVYEQRVLAETMISRPVMKGFKRTIREQGLFDGPSEGERSMHDAVA